MTVILYPTDPRQEAGFYRFLFAALRRHAGARLASGPRPLPRLEQPRQHESVWIEWDGARILMDMGLFKSDVGRTIMAAKGRGA